MRRRASRGETTSHAKPNHDRWLLSYADFVTLLFAVFVVLFAFVWKQKQPLQTMSSVVQHGFDAMGARGAETDIPPPASAPAGKAVHPSADPLPNPEQLYDQLHAILGDAIQRREIVMRETSEGLVISLRELGFFGSGEAKLLPGAADKIAAAAKLLKEKGFSIRVEGHSDDQPIHSTLYQSNWELSIARAMSVLRLLVDQADFPEERISAAGYGPFRPVASNDTPEGRKQNRRVDLVVVSANPASAP